MNYCFISLDNRLHLNHLNFQFQNELLEMARNLRLNARIRFQVQISRKWYE